MIGFNGGYLIVISTYHKEIGGVSSILYFVLMFQIKQFCRNYTKLVIIKVIYQV